ncbi:MAG: hypothetical protein J5804_01535, partial [Eggerthellaceae bacterium]|nr:hypothetical protein [Eggerthellaceae bacterium]
MLEETLFTLDMPYRQPMTVKAFSFGVDTDGRLLGGPGKTSGVASSSPEEAIIMDEAADPTSFENTACFVAGFRG